MNKITKVWKKLFSLPKGPNILFILVGLMVVMSFFSKYFLTITNLSNILIQAAVVAILAAGETLVIISGGIDLSIGTVMAMVSCTMGVLILKSKIGVFSSIILALLVGALAGFINGILVAKGKVPSFVATLGMMGIAQGIALLVTSGYSMFGFPEDFIFLGTGKILGIPIPIISVIIIYTIMHIVLEYTKIGRYNCAIGGNENASLLAGINVDKFKIIIFTICGLTAGLAGVVLSARISSSHPGIGAGFELDAIAATVIGGTSLRGGEGTMIGTLIGALIMAVIKNSLNLLGISPYIQKIAIGIIIITAVLLDSLGKRRKKII